MAEARLEISGGKVTQPGVNHGGPGIPVAKTADLLAVRWPSSTLYGPLGARAKYFPASFVIYAISEAIEISVADGRPAPPVLVITGRPILQWAATRTPKSVFQEGS